MIVAIPMKIGTINKYGLLFPILVLVLSTITPIIGSVIASIILATKNKVPMAAAPTLKLSVKNIKR